ncbi:hypothetical protein [Rhizobium ruizarguesonis]|uniref:hypothetical protein n=1 Tax=Rhizobium ruizarguesonis TaxID=2081791 RepID=UPI0010323D52|nr:hypothetical protein [Rhizobium ruizarguesonis]TAZ76562.1 hypothetical protein ELH68_01665 [Rhizobium ruizarguesonis]TBA03195.1 hypothetical protein ELH64_01650 [Rhizobium ruizarguesonis]
MKIEKLKHTERHDELAAKRNEIGEQLAKTIADQLALARNDEPEFSQAVDTAEALRVAQLIGQPPAQTPPSKRDRLAAMANEIRALRAAGAVLDGQIAVERQRAQSAYRSGIAPTYRGKLRAVVDAMRNVHAATLDLHGLATVVEDQGISIESLGFFSPSLLGSPIDPHSSMARFFREAAEIGVIDKKDVPAELQYK